MLKIIIIYLNKFRDFFHFILQSSDWLEKGVRQDTVSCCCGHGTPPLVIHLFASTLSVFFSRNLDHDDDAVVLLISSRNLLGQ